MAFFRFSRDKRGYEHFYLMQPVGRGAGRPRLLYWFRTPPNVRVGRGPFEPEIRHALEAQHPDVVFDWTAIARTPIPPPETERWRERRRAERQMRSAAQAEESVAEAVGEPLAGAPPQQATVGPAPASNDVESGAARRRRRRRRRRKNQIPGSVPSPGLVKHGNSENGGQLQNSESQTEDPGFEEPETDEP